MQTLNELINEQAALSHKIRMHVMSIPLPNRNAHADKLCKECQPWFDRSRQLVTLIYQSRNNKLTEPPVKKGIDIEQIL